MLRDVALWLRPAGWPPLPDAAHRRTWLLAWAVILAQAVFLGGWVLAGALEPNYSPVRQWALVAQAWALVCATVLILEATLEPGVLRAHEASIRQHASGELRS